MPAASVIVATYRRDAQLQRALGSLAEQNFRDFEIILVDDNDEMSWNETVETIVEDFRKEHPSCPLIYLQNHPHLGSARTRNVGITASAGEYVTFLDDDDLYLPTKIERQLQFMKDGNYDYSITDLYLFFENEKLAEKRIRHYITDTSPEQLFICHMKHHLTGTDTMMFRRDYLVQIGGFPEIDIGDEFYLMQRAIDSGGRFGYLQGCDVKAYVHGMKDSLSSGQGKIDGENRLFSHKSGFFHRMDKKTVRQIKVRHYAVLSYTYLRMKRFRRFFAYSVKSFWVSPVQFCKIIKSR